MPAPACPECGVSYADPEQGAYIATSQRTILQYNDGKWEKDSQDLLEMFQCSECFAELTVEELDNLGVPSEIR